MNVFMKTELKLTAVFEEAEEGGYIAFFEELPGVNTQGETLEEAKINLLDALDFVMDTQRREPGKEKGNQRITPVCFMKTKGFIKFLNQQHCLLIREGSNQLFSNNFPPSAIHLFQHSRI